MELGSSGSVNDNTSPSNFISSSTRSWRNLGAFMYCKTTRCISSVSKVINTFETSKSGCCNMFSIWVLIDNIFLWSFSPDWVQQNNLPRKEGVWHFPTISSNLFSSNSTDSGSKSLILFLSRYFWRRSLINSSFFSATVTAVTCKFSNLSSKNVFHVSGSFALSIVGGF